MSESDLMMALWTFTHKNRRGRVQNYLMIELLSKMSEKKSQRSIDLMDELGEHVGRSDSKLIQNKFMLAFNQMDFPDVNLTKVKSIVHKLS